MIESKKQILFVYPCLMLGGSTTSLLSLLSVFDYDKYDVDLLLLTDNKMGADKIPKEVNILPIAHKYESAKKRKLARILSPKYLFFRAVSKVISVKHKNQKYGEEYLVRKDLEKYRELGKEYDVAIGFLEGYSNIYVVKHVKAKKKIGWIHIDLMASGFNPSYDLPYFKVLDHVITVSEKCLESYREYCPEYKGKGVVIENILTKEYVVKAAQEEVVIDGFDKTKINFFTCCRIAFESKGLDRAVRVLSELKNEHLLDDFRWYIIGDGADRPALEKLIHDKNLNENVKLLGSIKNPYKYIKLADMFFLPSHWEGKPMAVTEAQLLGIPAFITEYASAREQVVSGEDGIVVSNCEDGIYEGLKEILTHPERIKKYAAATAGKNYSNLKEVEKLYDLIERQL